MSVPQRHQVVIAMPRYGDVSLGAALGWMCPSRGERMDVLPPINSCNSATPHTFNMLWAQALDMRDAGRATHFAMIHSDIEPVMPRGVDDPLWLDVLMGEMEANSLDVISAIVPIKVLEPPIRTSTAIGSKENHWPPTRYICVEDRPKLPETVLPEHVCNADEVLLLNTGLMLIDMRNEALWCDFSFEFKTTIVKHPETNQRIPVFLPEDWLMSRHVQERGGRLAATWKVPVNHHGSDYWTNYAEGPAPTTNGFVPPDIDGWLSIPEGAALERLASGKRVLEIGSYCGRSTVCLARTAKHVVSVDPHDGRTTPRPKSTLDELRSNLARFGVSDKVTVLVGTAAQTLNGHGPFDLAFIDGDHGYEAVKTDIGLAASRLAPDGVLAFHDYREHPGQCDGRWDAGVTRAVGELIEAGGEMVARHDTLAVVKPPAAMPGMRGD